jgi:heme A synthase
MRWIIVAVSLIALIWFVLVWLRGMRNEKADRGLMAAFSGLIDVQVLLGVIYILWSGFAGAGFPRYRLEHAVTMIVAAVVAHLSARWRNADAPMRARNNAALIILVLVIVLIGVSVLPQGWLG